MAKLTKQQAKWHREAQALLTQDTLTEDEQDFVVQHWREDAEHINAETGAFFTPWDLALDLALHLTGTRIIDLCAGIGTLSLAYWRRTALERRWEGATLDIVCIEKNPAYVDVGRKILPEATWICADVLDPRTVAHLGHFDSVVSNPPFGRLPRNGQGPRYTGAEFEFHVVDLGYTLADTGAFILPQQSCGFRYSGTTEGYRRDETPKYRRFAEQTGIDLDAGIGVDTTCEVYGPWRGTAPLVEIATTSDHATHHSLLTQPLAS